MEEVLAELKEAGELLSKGDWCRRRDDLEDVIYAYLTEFTIEPSTGI